MTFKAKRGLLLAGVAGMALTACSEPFDLDLRGGSSGGTSEAVRQATADRPDPDARGIISYPGYQVAVARRGDTLGSLAARIGADPAELARYNGIKTGDTLREGEVIALPGRVAEPSGGPIKPGGVDIESVAGGAIARADASSAPVTTTPLPSGTSGVEPTRHKVARGETAYTIARLYNVSIRSLAEWNGLGPDFSVREGQYLLIPVALPGETRASFDASEAPGAGSPTPEPPSAAKPLPKEDTVAVATLDKPKAGTQAADAPDLSKEQTKATPRATRMAMPVQGDIVREYAKGKNDGIDIAASPGASVKAADSGVVAAITEDTNGTPIVVVKHANNLLTVYSNVDNVSVKTGQKVSRGQALAKARSSGASAVHFEVRDGFDSLDPMPYLTN
ncbi:LysM peptidoglycan-binding domain-containing M23 family metallopeptidase [Roseovarius sp. SCSIO 43702]|uniref:LysM peptidoglycan-binding domain-containing M23 family metallopeptidase n=1 Tax=Roseovarius sp. SCSIO 43702 TaxID=2823043 RepID=UPI001C731410|nr:LysM peptidoglycan-binding domain-containing M23 family metallopeptidase [Roseovarius sp. SCSIO 43702]QYX58434.1 LysM peptidoglycan-binding domain-containing M23 family metallopeptidase [Roseovarius sp. SCSIO 43702]